MYPWITDYGGGTLQVNTCARKGFLGTEMPLKMTIYNYWSTEYKLFKELQLISCSIESGEMVI